MTTRSWLRNLLTTVLARLTRRDPSSARPKLGWNGRPRVAAPEGTLSPDSPKPALRHSTLSLSELTHRSEPTCSVEPRGDAGAGQVAT